MSIATDALKTPPHDLDAERSVLGAILIDPSSLHLASEFLRADYFYQPQHQMIYSCMISLFEQQQPIDLVTVKSQLQKDGHLKQVGGTAFLSDLINAVPTSANIEHYAMIVKGHSAKRKLIELSSRLVEKAFDERADVKKLLDSAESEIFAISQASTQRDFIELKDILTESFERLEAFAKDGTGLRGVPTGYTDLDNKLAGMQAANLLILAARPGVGKTSFALNIALNAATKHQTPVGFFSLEMSKEELVDRLLVSQADVDAWKLKTGRLSDQDFKKLTEAMGELSSAPIFIDDTPGISILEMRSKARKLKVEKGLKFLVVDYLQLADAGKRFESRVQEVSYVSQGLKNLARELQIPVLSLSQLSRMVEQRGSKKPQLSDLRECLAGDTLIVEAATGALIPIEKMYQSAGHWQVLSLDSTGRLIPCQVEKVVQSGTKSVCELTTSAGDTIKTSRNHPFLTPRGWVALEKINVGDLIAVPRKLPIAGKPNINKDLARLLGYMVGDGSYLRHRSCGFTNADAVVAQDAIAIAQQFFGIRPKIDHHNNAINVDFVYTYENGYGKPHGNPLMNYLREIGIFGQRTEIKQAPSVVMQADYAEVVQFLRGLFTADGTIVQRKSGRIEIKYASKSLLLIRQIKQLLLRLGIAADIRQGRKGKFHIYYLEIDDRDAMITYIEQVGFVGKKQAKAERCSIVLKSRSINSRSYLYPRELTEYVKQLKMKNKLSWTKLGYRCQGKRLSLPYLKKVAAVLKDTHLQQLAEADFHWVKVRRLTNGGQAMTYDLVVKGVHNFVANHMIVHNSGAIEQDADVVMFIYSEMDSTDELNVSPTRPMKLLIAKHRNGSTGEIDLVFRGDRVKFYSVDKSNIQI